MKASAPTDNGAQFHDLVLVQLSKRPHDFDSRLPEPGEHFFHAR